LIYLLGCYEAADARCAGTQESNLEAEIARCDDGVLRHHCPGGDFSGWVAGVFRDGLAQSRRNAALQATALYNNPMSGQGGGAATTSPLPRRPADPPASVLKPLR
jgi:hypothetical protein